METLLMNLLRKLKLAYLQFTNKPIRASNNVICGINCKQDYEAGCNKEGRKIHRLDLLGPGFQIEDLVSKSELICAADKAEALETIGKVLPKWERRIEPPVATSIQTRIITNDEAATKVA